MFVTPPLEANLRAFSPFRFSRHGLNEPLVVFDLGLQLHLHAQQVVVGLHLAPHLRPHLLELLLQLQDQLVERSQALAVLVLGALQGLLQVVDLGLERRIDDQSL